MSPWSPQRGSSSRLWGERGSCSDDCRMHHRSPIYTVRLIADDSYSGVCDVTQTVRNVALHIFYHEVTSGNCAVGCSNFHTSEWQSHATIVSSSRNIIYETYLGLEKRFPNRTSCYRSINLFTVKSWNRLTEQRAKPCICLLQFHNTNS